MSIKQLIFVAALGAAIGLANPAMAADIQVSEADNGGTVALHTGQCLAIGLRLQSGTGYDWYMLPNSTPLMHLYGRSVTTAGTADHKPLVGGPATDTFSLCAGEDGEGQVLFGYKRPWENNVLPAKIFEITVKIER
jgi:predicted secreted protein